MNLPDVLLTKGQTAQIVTNIVPENVSDKTFTYTSSSPNIASVDGSGVITGLANKESTTTITVKSHNGKTAIVNVRVINPVTKVGITSTGYNEAAISQFSNVTKMTFNLSIQTGVDYQSISWQTMIDGYTLGPGCTSGAMTCTITAKNDNVEKIRYITLIVIVKNNLGNEITASKTIDLEGKFKVAHSGIELFGIVMLSKTATLTITPKTPAGVGDFKSVESNSNLILDKVSEGKHTIKCKSNAETGKTFTVKYQSLTGQTDIVKLQCTGN